jgi:hypothetical protein
VLVGLQRLQRLALDARHKTCNEPARCAHLDYRDQRPIEIEGGEGPAQIVRLGDGRANPSADIGEISWQDARARRRARKPFLVIDALQGARTSPVSGSMTSSVVPA